MKLLVFGAGVIGTMHAWAFENAGHSVSLLVRPGHEDRWTNGIELQILDGREGHAKEVKTQYHPHVVTSFTPDDGYDVVIEAVRYTQTEEVLPELVANLGEAILLLFSNNWSGLESIDRVLPKTRYVLGMPRAGGVMANGVLNGAIDGPVILGASTCGQSGPPAVGAVARQNLDSVAGLFRNAGFAPDVQENMEHWYWVHFASTATWTGASAKAGGFGFARRTGAIHEALVAGREAMDVCRARGVNVRKFDEARPFLQPPWLMAPLLRRLMTRDLTTRGAQTHSDYAPEFQRIYHDVVETGRQSNVGTRHLDAYRAYVDATGKEVRAA
jgi:2-dehydropantoate 2-reductase